MTEVSNLLDRVRALINEPGRQEALRRGEMWLQLASSLDVTGDTELAITAYLATTDEPNESAVTGYGLLYLRAYGLLQALFLQQDAVCNLCEALGTPFQPKEDLRLNEVRRIRNSSTGHPTRLRRGGTESHHGIARISLTDKGFQLYSFGSSEMEWVDLSRLMQEQAEAIREKLSCAIEKLEES